MEMLVMYLSGSCCTRASIAERRRETRSAGQAEATRTFGPSKHMQAGLQHHFNLGLCFTIKVIPL